MCIDYRALNKITVKNRYPIPHIANLFDQLGSVRWFTELDLRLGYHQVQIAERDKPKIACVTQYVSRLRSMRNILGRCSEPCRKISYISRRRSVHSPNARYHF
ncbi:RNA-directed DNA polymerase-like protein [Gossypium australe]|uniref:RNA-directed DNA polymerase-like protein n=1 Tax=Gossypium australe TaxID=47621 RepID=A0A5B6WRQ7_9ROSI|nr:RNA-directed DNA polymerase-like protein [Gossypium australe]